MGEPSERPQVLLSRYRALCEARGLARASRVQLAPEALTDLARLEEHLVALLTAEPPPVARVLATAGMASALTDPGHHAAKAHAPAAVVPAPGPLPVARDSNGPDQERTIVFTDGAAEGNPGPGGYCAIVRQPGQPDRELSGGIKHTTNNKMELTGAIVGLRTAVEAGATDITVISDSEYVIKGMSKWLANWERRDWKTTNGQPVKNRELWEQLAALIRGRTVRWEWTKGHAGHPENERCDALATQAARQAARSPSA